MIADDSNYEPRSDQEEDYSLSESKRIKKNDGSSSKGESYGKSMKMDKNDRRESLNSNDTDVEPLRGPAAHTRSKDSNMVDHELSPDPHIIDEIGEMEDEGMTIEEDQEPQDYNSSEVPKETKNYDSKEHKSRGDHDLDEEQVDAKTRSQDTEKKSTENKSTNSKSTKSKNTKKKADDNDDKDQDEENEQDDDEDEKQKKTSSKKNTSEPASKKTAKSKDKTKKKNDDDNEEEEEEESEDESDDQAEEKQTKTTKTKSKKDSSEKKDKSKSKNDSKGDKSSGHLEPGDKVSWNYGQGQGEGEVAKKYTEPVEKTIKGSNIKRNASKDEPAYEVKQKNGNKVLKKEGELTEL